MTRKINDAIARVAALVRTANEPLRPWDVIDQLKTEGFTEAEVRAAFWYGIDQGAFLLTAQRRLFRRVERAEDV